MDIWSDIMAVEAELLLVTTQFWIVFHREKSKSNFTHDWISDNVFIFAYCFYSSFVTLFRQFYLQIVSFLSFLFFLKKINITFILYTNNYHFISTLVMQNDIQRRSNNLERNFKITVFFAYSSVLIHEFTGRLVGAG